MNGLHSGLLCVLLGYRSSLLVIVVANYKPIINQVLRIIKIMVKSDIKTGCI